MQARVKVLVPWIACVAVLRLLPVAHADELNVAIADPETAPYGVAAEQVLFSLNELAPLRAANKSVAGESVGNAQQTGSVWLIPAARYKRLDQDAVVLSRSAKPEPATKFLHWLRTDSAAIQTIEAAGYALSKTLIASSRKVVAARGSGAQ